MSNYITTNAELISIADAIRAKTGTTMSLTFPSEFVNEINSIGPNGMYIEYIPHIDYGSIMSGSSYLYVKNWSSGVLGNHYDETCIPAYFCASLYENTLTTDYSHKVDVVLDGWDGGEINLSVSTIQYGAFSAAQLYDSNYNYVSQFSVTTNAKELHNCFGWTGMTKFTDTADSIRINEALFTGCVRLSLISFPNCVLLTYNYGRNAVNMVNSDCTSLYQLYMPNVKNISYLTMTSLPLRFIDFPELVSTQQWTIRNLTNISYINLPKLSDTYGTSQMFYNSPLLTSVNMPLIEDLVGYSGYGPFGKCTSLSEIELPALTYLGGGAAFDGCTALQNVSMSKLASIKGSNNFRSCISLESIYFPSLTLLSGSENFTGCTMLSSVSFPNILTLSGSKNFGGCTALTSVCFPLLETITGSFFGGTSNYIETIDLPTLSTLGPNTFQGCNRLISVSIPNLTTINGINVFSGCSSLMYAYFPSLQTMQGNATFYGCTSIYELSFPLVQETSGSSTFYGCTRLSSISFGNCSKLSGNMKFRNCYNLISLFLTGSELCVLGNTVASMFGSTPVSTYSTSAGRYASIFVRRSLVDTYKNATNWTTVKTKIFAYEDYFNDYDW